MHQKVSLINTLPLSKFLQAQYFQAIKFNDKDEKSFYWAAQDYSEEIPALETFAIRFKTAEIAQEFKKAAADVLTGAAAAPRVKSPVKDQTDGA